MLGDRVEQTTATAGVGTFTLIAPPANRRSFVAAIGSGNPCTYAIEEGTTKYEVGIGTVTVGPPDTLSRDTVLYSSNAGLKENFTGAVKSVVATPVAELLGTTGARLVFVTTTGSANAYLGTARPLARNLTAPLWVLAKANFSNTGAATYNHDGLGILPLRKGDGTVALVANDWLSGQVALLALDPAAAVWIMVGRWTIQAADLPAATTTAQGASELATLAEADAHADTVRAVTPAALANHVLKTRAVNTGTGLQGGGDLTADRTLALANTAVAAGAYTKASLTVDAQGRLTAASSGAADVLTAAYESAGQALGSGTTLTLAHGLGAEPKIVILHLVVLAGQTDLGYSAGEKVFVPGEPDTTSVSGCTVQFDATNIYIAFTVNGQFTIRNKATSAIGNTNSSKWNLVARAFR